jgi:acetylornithine deacetylase/succinyl-diaminopimelate desuccinylase-like protein
VIADDQVSLTLATEPDPGPSSAMREDILKAMTRVTDTMWPSVPVVPVMVTYATDGRFLRKQGIPAYGVQGLFQDRDDIRWHGRDERIPVQSYKDAEKFLYDLVKSLSTNGK